MLWCSSLKGYRANSDPEVGDSSKDWASRDLAALLGAW